MQNEIACKYQIKDKRLQIINAVCKSNPNYCVGQLKLNNKLYW